MSNQLQPSGDWTRLDLTCMDGTVLIRQSAERTWGDPDSYYDGQKHKEIINIGDAVRSLSDFSSGSPEVAIFTVDVNDKSGFWRALLADWNTLHLSSQDFTYYFASARAHSTRAIPHVEFRGQIKQPVLISGRKFRITAESRIGTRTGPFWIDGAVLRRGHNVEDLPNLPRANWGKPLAGLWGEYSDEWKGEFAQGCTVPTNCGIVGSGGPPPSPILLPPPTLSVTVTGSGPSLIVDAVVVATVRDGGTVMSNIVRVSNYPEVQTGGYYASWSWIYNGGYDSDIMSVGIYAKRIGIDSRYYLLDRNINTTSPPPSTSYVHNGSTPGDDHFGKAMYPPPPENNTAVVDGSDGAGVPKRFYSLAFHEGEIIAIYGKDLQPLDETVPTDENTAGTGRPQRTKVTTGEIGTTFTLDVTKVINGNTYYGFEASGPRADAHDDGSMPFQVNWCGRHDADGKVINQITHALLDMFIQTLGNNGKGLTDAPITTIPNFRASPTIPMFDTVSFENVQDQTIEEMGTELGALTRIYIDKFETTYRTVLQSICKQYGIDYGESNEGQIKLAMMSPLVDISDLPTLRKREHIKSVVAPGGGEDEEIRNFIRYKYMRCGDKLESGTYTIKDDDSIDGYGERKEDLDMPYIDDKETADWAAGRFLAFRAIAPSYPEIAFRFKGVLNYELGNVIVAQHHDLVTSDPMPMYIRKRITSKKQGSITLISRDLSMILGQTFAAPGLADIGDPTDEADTELRDMMLLGDESSTAPFPDGALRLS